MKVCYFGSYDRQYARNSVIIKGLTANGVEVIECNDRSRFFRRALKLFTKAVTSDFDILFVGYPGHLDVFVAKLVSLIKRRPLVFDVFISNYDTNVLDNKIIEPGSFAANYSRFVDKYSCIVADLVLLDTDEHVEYFVNEYGLDKGRFRVVPIGADEDIFYPRERRRGNQEFIALHYGKTSGLHGVEYIVKAFELLAKHKDIKLVLIGYREDLRKFSNSKGNIEFMDLVPLEVVSEYIASSDICLGLFGGTGKADRVVPNKIYEALAMKRAVVTGESSAVRSILVHGESVFLCRMADPEALAEAVLLMKNNPELREKIAEEGYRVFKERFTPTRIGERLMKILDECFGR